MILRVVNLMKELPSSLPSINSNLSVHKFLPRFYVGLNTCNSRLTKPMLEPYSGLLLLYETRRAEKDFQIQTVDEKVG